MAQRGPKIGFLDFCAKLGHYVLLEMTENEAYYGWITFFTNRISGKILILEIYVQKLSTNQIAQFFKLLYLLNRSTVFYHFLHKHITYKHINI